MSKTVDNNGFWLIENNPVSKEGVFPYLGKTISATLEPDKLYNVYRSFDELSKPETLKSFDGIPFIENHEMIGDGFTSADERVPQGVLMNVRPDGRTLVGDLKIFSDALKTSIENGKKELSLGYRCNYRIQPGEWNGIKYDVIQTDLRGNHIALVDKGRMGSAVRVYDWAMDSLEIANPIQTKKQENESMDGNPNEPKNNGPAKDEAVDKRKLIDEIGGMLKDKVSEEEWRTIIGKAEKIAYNGSEASKADDKKAQDRCGKDEFFDGPKMEALVSKLMRDGKLTEEVAKQILASSKYSRGEDEDGEKGDVKKNDAPAMDASDIVKMIDRRDAMRREMSAFVGDFACDGMTEEDVAKYCCDKLGLDSANAIATIKGFAAGAKKNDVTLALDAKPATRVRSGVSEAMKDYLAGK